MKIGESFAGIGTAATRVIEMYYPEDQRLFDDPLANELLPLGWRLLLGLAYLPGLRSAVLALRERRMPGSLGGDSVQDPLHRRRTATIARRRARSGGDPRSGIRHAGLSNPGHGERGGL